MLDAIKLSSGGVRAGFDRLCRDRRGLLGWGIWVAFLIAAGFLGALRMRSTDTTAASSLGPAEQLLGAGEYGKALPLLQDRLERNAEDVQALYGVGLCYLGDSGLGDVAGVIERLRDHPRGREYAEHLHVLSLMQNGDLQEAQQALIEWDDRGKHRLPFLLSQGLIAFENSDFARAESTLGRSLNEASFFRFQAINAIDALAKLFLRKGSADQAVSLYAQNIDHDHAASVPASVMTNYALALRATGQTGKADEVIRQTLQVHPSDELCAFLDQQTRGSNARREADDMGQLIRLLDDIDETISDDGEDQDPWRSSPLVLQVLPLKETIGPHSRLGQADFLWRQVADALRDEEHLPIVAREELPRLLAEIRLSSSDLAPDDVKVRLGQLLPASVLVCPTFESRQSSLSIRIKLVDVATSQIIGVVTRTVDGVGMQEQVAHELASDIMSALREFHPLVGRIVEAEDTELSMNIGHIHGVRIGCELGLYRVPRHDSVERLRMTMSVGRIRITAVTRLAATAEIISLGDGIGRRSLRGMVAVEPLRK